ncbi:MAG: class I SAM-dependent RNA methyltransferase [Treponemataceae bacterium]
MAIGDLIDLKIEKISSEGDGVGRFEGKTIFVAGAAPEERVQAYVEEEKKLFARASLAKVLVPSSSRIEPVCPVFGECGGCSLQHIDYSMQIQQKKSLLKDAFSRIGGFTEIPAIRTFPSAPYEYRNRMQFHRVKKNSAVGLKKRAGNEVMTISDCPIADPGIRQALRAGSLVSPPWTDRFQVFSSGALFLSEGGVEKGETNIAGKKLKLDVGGFFQSNVHMLETLLAEVTETAKSVADSGRNSRVLDLYCGVGTFGAFLTDYFENIDLVELDKKAAALARENVKSKGARLFAVSDDDWAKRIESRQSYDFAVVDPPRVGLSSSLRKWLIESKPETLVYVSCDPATLARDAKELSAAAFELRSLSLYDFYPQTPHIESLAVFGRRD